MFVFFNRGLNDDYYHDYIIIYSIYIYDNVNDEYNDVAYLLKFLLFRF